MQGCQRPVETIRQQLQEPEGLTADGKQAMEWICRQHPPRLNPVMATHTPAVGDKVMYTKAPGESPMAAEVVPVPEGTTVPAGSFAICLVGYRNIIIASPGQLKFRQPPGPTRKVGLDPMPCLRLGVPPRYLPCVAHREFVCVCLTLWHRTLSCTALRGGKTMAVTLRSLRGRRGLRRDRLSSRRAAAMAGGAVSLTAMASLAPSAPIPRAGLCRNFPMRWVGNLRQPI